MQITPYFHSPSSFALISSFPFLSFSVASTSVSPCHGPYVACKIKIVYTELTQTTHTRLERAVKLLTHNPSRPYGRSKVHFLVLRPLHFHHSSTVPIASAPRTGKEKRIEGIPPNMSPLDLGKGTFWRLIPPSTLESSRSCLVAQSLVFYLFFTICAFLSSNSLRFT